MEIVIKIPKEFENHFNSDKFEDSLQRVRFDIHKAIIAKKDILSGNYEIETLDMLTEAFLKGTPLPKGHGDLKDADVMKNKLCTHEASELFGSTTCAEILDFINDEKPIIEADKSVIVNV